MRRLSRALDTAATTLTKYPSHLEQPVYEGMLPLLGTLFSQRGLEILIGTQLKLPRDVEHERISVALQVGLRRSFERLD
jgi:hypothetical protein